MLQNYLKLTLRNLWKNKTFSFINISGLAIGIAAFLLILQYVLFERSYDLFHEKGDRIYRLQQDRYNDGKLSTRWAAGAAGIGKLMKESFPEVETMSKLRPEEGVMSYGDKKFNESKLYFATDDFLPMFSYKIIKGKAEGSLKEPFTAVITESTAKKYFGNEEAIGKVLSYNKETNYKVTAVVADMPDNTHLKFDMLFSFSTLGHDLSPEDKLKMETAFFWDGYYTYVLLRPGTNIALLEKKIQKQVNEAIKQEIKEYKEGLVYHLQPMRDIHLYSNFMYEAEPNGNGQAVYFLLIIAVFIIVIAWINYINLSTARSVERAKEVGIRKVMGSYRSQLISQFMFESLLVNLFAVVMGLALVLLSLPLFNSLTGKQVSFSLLGASWFWLALTGLFMTGTLLAGLYPAFVMSSFKPITVLKGKFARSRQGTFLRQSLVIIQFTSSVILMIGTFGVYRQLNFMQNQDTGIKIDRTLVLKGPQVLDTSTYRGNLNTFKTELRKIPGIEKIVVSTSVPGKKVGWNAGGIRLADSDPATGKQYRAIGIDYDFVDAFGLKMIHGRNFSDKITSDREAVLFNEVAVKQLGFDKSEEAIGKRIEFWGRQYTIIGIVSNHHQEGLKEAYDAHVYRLTPRNNNFYFVKFSPSKDPQEVITAVEKEWNRMFAGNPYDYFFLDDHFLKQYNADQQFGKTFALFAVLAIIVACLGLLGLASFATSQRTKEIGIRKIAGATLSKLLLLLTGDFIKPVLVSFLIAVPVTYYLLDRWLQDYAFKMPLGMWLFILPLILITVIALVTISTQTLKAATANPVKSLRTE